MIPQRLKSFDQKNVSRILKVRDFLKGLSHEMDFDFVKPTKTRINRDKYNICVRKSLEHLKKFKNWPRPLVRPRTDYACHQKPNSSRAVFRKTKGELCFIKIENRWDSGIVCPMFLFDFLAMQFLSSCILPVLNIFIDDSQ
jgi:hypothetical protein